MDLKLKGKTAAVTGASKGIGAAVAQSLAAEGCHLDLAARSADALEALAGELRESNGVEVRTHALDLAQSEAQADFTARCASADILINNAGAIPSGDLGDLDEAAWRAGWELKVFGYVSLCRSFYAAMRARGAGVIVNIIGLAGAKPDAGYIAGSAGNAALIQFTQALGGRAPQHGLRVVGINPSLTATERAVGMVKFKAEKAADSAEFERTFLDGLPFGRMAKPEEIADMAAFLASERAGYVSGAVIDIDGGTRWRS